MIGTEYHDSIVHEIGLLEHIEEFIELVVNVGDEFVVRPSALTEAFRNQGL